MTIPVLRKALDERANLSALKKFYSEFYSATNLIMVDNEAPSHWGLRDNNSASSAEIIELYRNRLHIVKECDTDDTSCFPFPVYGSNGSVKITAGNYKGWSFRGFMTKAALRFVWM